MTRPKKQRDGLAALEALIDLIKKSRPTLPQVKAVLAEAKASRTTGPQATPRSITATTLQAYRKQLCSLIAESIDRRGLNHEAAAKVLKTTRPRVTNVCNGKVNKMTLTTLFEFLILLGQEVTITVRPKAMRRRGNKAKPSRSVNIS